MKKLINFFLFILLFLLIKELIYLFYENWNFLSLDILNVNDYFKFSVLIAISSFLFSFIFLVFHYAFKELNIIYKIISYFISLTISLIFVNFIYAQFITAIDIFQIILNIIFVILVSLIINFIFLQLLVKNLK